MLIASLLVAFAQPAPAIAFDSAAMACTPTAGRPLNCTPHTNARENAPIKSAAGRTVCHPDPTKSGNCFARQLEEAELARAETRKPQVAAR